MHALTRDAFSGTAAPYPRSPDPYVSDQVVRFIITGMPGAQELERLYPVHSSICPFRCNAPSMCTSTHTPAYPACDCVHLRKSPIIHSSAVVLQSVPPAVLPHGDSATPCRPPSVNTPPPPSLLLRGSPSASSDCRSGPGSLDSSRGVWLICRPSDARHPHMPHTHLKQRIFHGQLHSKVRMIG